MINTSLKELGTALAQGKVSAVELATLFLTRIDSLNPKLNAFITLDRESTLAQARNADALRAAGKAGKRPRFGRDQVDRGKAREQVSARIDKADAFDAELRFEELG